MMKNSYYHAFEVGFNWWMVLAMVGILVLAYAGWNNPYRSHRTGKIKKHFVDRFYIFLSAVFTVAFTILLCVESRDGILQFFDNGLMWNESPFWSLLEASAAIPFIGIVFGFILYYAGKIAEGLKKNQLRSMRQREIASFR